MLGELTAEPGKVNSEEKIMMFKGYDGMTHSLKLNKNSFALKNSVQF